MRKLNGPLARRTTRDVTSFRLSADGLRAFYLADSERDEGYALFSVPADGSSPALKLSQAVGSSPQRVESDFQIGADAARVAFRQYDGFGSYHLFGVSSSGGEVPVRLDPFTISSESVETGYRVSADGTRVVYRADRTLDGMLELWSAPLDGSAAPARLNAPLPTGGDVLDFDLSSDGTRVVYRADQRLDELFELFSVSLDASSAPLRLNAPLVSGGDVSDGFRLAPDGARAVYVADQDTNNTFYLYSVPLDASAAPRRLMPFNTSQNYEPDFVITGDGQRVVYRFFVGGRTLQLFGTPIDGTASAVLLTGGLGLPESGVQPGFRAGPGGDVLFRASAGGSLHVFSVPADGSAAPARLDDLADFGGQVLDDFRFSSDGRRALFRAERGAASAFQLFSAAREGAAAPLDLAGPLVPGGDVLAFQERDGWVAYVADQEQDDVQELFQVPVDGSAPPVPQNDVLLASADVQLDFQLAPGGQTAFFRADARRDDTFELFTTSAGEPDLALNPPFDPATDLVGSVASFALAGERVVYRASESTFGLTELHSAPLRGGAGPVTLNPTFPEVQHYKISPDGRLVVYSAGQFFGSGVELFSVPVDGSAAPTRRNGDLVAGGSVRFDFTAFQISADGRRVVYLADQRVDGQFELFAATLQASGEPVLLTPLRTPARAVAGFELTPDSRRAVYVADQDFEGRYELYSVLLDGASPPVRIAAMQNAGGSLAHFQIAADSMRVVYSADQLLNDQFELFVTRVDGGVPTRRLSAPMFARGDVRTFTIGADLERVLYEADQDVEQVFQLFSVPLSGSSALGLELTPPLTRATKVLASRLSADGAWAVYHDRALQLFSAPVDGSGPARLLHGDFAPMHGVSYDFAPSPDSTRVAYIANPGLLQRWELFSVPIAAGAPPVRLNPPLIRQRRVWSFGFSNDGGSLAYIANQESDDERELYVVPTDGSAPPRKLSGPMTPKGGVTNFAFGATASEAVYIADQDTDQVFELYSSELPSPPAGVRRR